jgi:hypothetical protein
MARTVDLAWIVARCNGDELEFFEPPSNGEAPGYLCVVGVENIRDLRDFLSECISDQELRTELDRNTVAQAIDTPNGTE